MLNRPVMSQDSWVSLGERPWDNLTFRISLTPVKSEDELKRNVIHQIANRERHYCGSLRDHHPKDFSGLMKSFVYQEGGCFKIYSAKTFKKW